MLTKPIGLLVVFAAGWALGRARPPVNLLVLALTMFAAVTAHSGMQAAFFEGRLHAAVGDPRGGAPEAVLVLIAAGEAVGLWVPFLVLPWTHLTARLWGSVYVLATATLAAATFYFPFDVAFFNDGLLMPDDGPPYLLAVLALLPIAAIGYLGGWMRSYNDRTDR